MCFTTLVAMGVTCFAQKNVKAYVLDDETGEELPFVSVFAKKAGVGTMTNHEGEFT